VTFAAFCENSLFGGSPGTSAQKISKAAKGRPHDCAGWGRQQERSFVIFAPFCENPLFGGSSGTKAVMCRRAFVLILAHLRVWAGKILHVKLALAAEVDDLPASEKR
jgi:hypothetical protein